MWYCLFLFLYGGGFCPQFSIALTHIDDHVPASASAFMLSLPTASFFLGPIPGFALGIERVDIFSRGHATLHLAVSVGRSVSWYVGR